MCLVSTIRIATIWTLIAVVSLWVAGCHAREERAPHGTTGWSVPSDEAIATLLAERMKHNGVGMVVGVIDGERRSVIAYGVSGAANGRPVDGATVFQLGSLTKVITTLLLADMVARGEVRLDDPVSAVLPSEAAMIEVGRPITLRDLATHTSGLPSTPTNIDIHGEPDPYEAYPVDSLWAFLARFRPDRAPGMTYEYSNLGVSLLGRALALRMGSTYEPWSRRGCCPHSA
jgi:D-alanyl-D-alanine-carboxypeptidase/D-alanyl-D-alanine-endopeptidase